MIFYDRLNWNAHIKRLAESSNRRLNLLKTLAHKEWGSDCHTLLHVYRTLIRSKMDFGCIAYDSANKTTLKFLDTSLTHFDTLNTDSQAIKNELNQIISDWNQPAMVQIIP
ncbi:hypothetical protein JTB14_007380 [Gonioctena quinquepunctata]|nr:hypothetical protein JTB14_007380 [Gonioctena quinquepunctata]